MKLFKEIDINEDERDHPLDERDLPLSMQIQADSDLDNEFGINDEDYDAIDSISPQIDSGVDNNPSDESAGLPLHDVHPKKDFDDSELDMDLNSNGPEDNPEDETTEEPKEDPNFQGVIRTVKGACLVYKRQNAENTFDELWIFNVGKDMKTEYQVKKAILAGTDINPQSGESDSNTEDSKQSMDSYSVGNVSFLELNNLPQ
jgi:hypothetical protein